MKKKCNRLAGWSFVLAVSILVFSYISYHYILPIGAFTTVCQPEPGKPWVTFLFAIWGVLFLFSGVMSLLIGHIFFAEEEKPAGKRQGK